MLVATFMWFIDTRIFTTSADLQQPPRPTDLLHPVATIQHVFSKPLSAGHQAIQPAVAVYDVRYAAAGSQHCAATVTCGSKCFLATGNRRIASTAATCTCRAASSPATGTRSTAASGRVRLPSSYCKSPAC